ncbi:MAG: PIN domain-containing protein [Planctomycetota bacterium]
MGALILPATGSVYLEANAVIYTVEKIEPYSSFLKPLWIAAAKGSISIVTSELTWTETLTKPMREKNEFMEMLFRDFLSAPEIQLIPATLALWEHTARLRASGLKTPDALHAATSISSHCALFLTNDSVFKRIPNLPVLHLKTAISS